MSKEPRLGDSVYYVTHNGQRRAATVTSDDGTMTVCLNVHKNGPHDWIGHTGGTGSVVVWLGDIPYGEYRANGGAIHFRPHSWHWPEDADNA